MFQLRDALSVGSIHLSTEFFCLSQSITLMKQQLEDELRSYSVVVEPSKTPFGKGDSMQSSPPSKRGVPHLLAPLAPIALTSSPFHTPAPLFGFRSQKDLHG